MSRIGKKPVNVPDGVTATLSDKGTVQIKGPQGTSHFNIPTGCEIKQEDKKLIIINKNKGNNAIYGLARALLANVVKGVSQGFSKELELVGVGYRAKVEGRKIIFTLGYSVPVEYHLPEGIDAKVANERFTISGSDKQRVGQTASEIRNLRPPEPYKGKGIKYADEVIRRKAGKTMGGSTAGAPGATS